MGIFKKGKPGDSEGSGHGKNIFEPTETERGLIAEFGGGNRTPFLDVRARLTELGLPVERGGLVWEAIRESRTQRQTQGGAERH